MLFPFWLDPAVSSAHSWDFAAIHDGNCFFLRFEASYWIFRVALPHLVTQSAPCPLERMFYSRILNNWTIIIYNLGCESCHLMLGRVTLRADGGDGILPPSVLSQPRPFPGTQWMVPRTTSASLLASPRQSETSSTESARWSSPSDLELWDAYYRRERAASRAWRTLCFADRADS